MNVPNRHLIYKIGPFSFMFPFFTKYKLHKQGSYSSIHLLKFEKKTLIYFFLPFFNNSQDDISKQHPRLVFCRLEKGMISSKASWICKSLIFHTADTKFHKSTFTSACTQNINYVSYYVNPFPS